MKVLVWFALAYLTANVTISQSTAYPFPPRIAEGRYADFLVSLASIPLQNVTVVLQADAHVTLDPAVLHFTPQGWNSSQVLRVYALDDGVVDPPNFHSNMGITLFSQDPKFDNISLASVHIPLTDSNKGKIKF